MIYEKKILDLYHFFRDWLSSFYSLINTKEYFLSNKYHGPSTIDFIRIVLMIVVWLLMLIESVKQYRKIFSRLKPQGLLICLILIIGGLIWVVFSIDKNTNAQWTLEASVAIIGYAVPFYLAFKKG